MGPISQPAPGRPIGQIGLGIVLILVGSFTGVPAILLLGLVLVVVELLHQLWVRRGLDGVEYRRRLPHTRAVVGDELPLDITVWNRKRLPLAWLRAADEVSAGVSVRERRIRLVDVGPDVLPNAWTLAPFERVTRHFHVVAERRGVYALGPVALEVGDLFARSAAQRWDEGSDRWLVRPRTVPVAIVDRDNPWGGELRARRGLIPDPTRYAGVRPYQPGDPLRSIHWRATARLGAPVTRRHEPGRHHEVVVALDLQTVPGSGGMLTYDDDLVEGLCVAAASLLRRLSTEGAAIGLAAAGHTGARQPIAFLPPGASPGQLGRCLDLLARIGSMPSAPFDQLLTTLVRRLRPGTAVVALTALDAGAGLDALRRVAAAGFRAQLLRFGGDEPPAALGRRGGIEIRSGRLDGPWRTAEAMVVS